MALTLTSKARARWVWATGMMVVSPTLGRYRLTEANQTRPTSDCAPDLTDDVTAACLPLVVRTVWKVPTLYCCQKGNGKWGINIWTPPGMLMAFSNAATEAEAWIAALEAAP